MNSGFNMTDNNNARHISGNRRPGLNERVAAFVCGVLLLITLLITATQAVCYWIPGWWRSEYAKYDTPQYVTGEMSLDDAVYITEQMLEYCIGRLDTLADTEATIDGVTAPFFTDRELSHLSDCRNVFLGAVRFRMVSIIVMIGLLLAIYFSVKKRSESALAQDRPEDDQRTTGSQAVAAHAIKRDFGRILARGYLIALAALLIFAAVIVIIGMRDFTYLFTEFHHVFFDNDLWILDPRYDNLVNVMQEAVFADAAVTIGCIWASCAGIITIVSILYLRRTRR